MYKKNTKESERLRTPLRKTSGLMNFFEYTYVDRKYYNERTAVLEVIIYNKLIQRRIWLRGLPAGFGCGGSPPELPAGAPRERK